MQEAPAQGGGVAEKIVGLDADLAKLATLAAENPQVPEDAKAALQASLDAFRQFTQLITGPGAQGGAPADPSAPVPMEAGTSGAMPVSHGRPG